MFPPQFDYYRAESVDEAIDLLAEHQNDDQDARVLAGGHGLLPELKARSLEPGVLIDVGGIDSLRYIEQYDDDSIRVGALTTYATIADSDALWNHASAFAEAVRNVGDVQIRNRGTIGGNLAQADPAADPPAAVLVSGATIHVRGPDGERTIDASDFFHGAGETALDDAEVVTAITLPRNEQLGGAYLKQTHPASGYAMVGVAAVIEVDDGVVTDTRVAMNGVTDPPTRLDSVESDIVGEAVDDAAALSEEAVDISGVDSLSDAYASVEYRTAVLPTHVRRALETAIGRATGEIPAAPNTGNQPITGGGHR